MKTFEWSYWFRLNVCLAQHPVWLLRKNKNNTKFTVMFFLHSFLAFCSWHFDDSLSQEFLHLVTDGLITHRLIFVISFLECERASWSNTYLMKSHCISICSKAYVISDFLIFSQSKEIKFTALNVYAYLFFQINCNSQIFLQSLISLWDL